MTATCSETAEPQATKVRRLPAGPTGLGTSAVRISPNARGKGAQPSTAASDGSTPHRQPRFSIPFPSQIGPDVERARQRGLRWARSMEISRTEQGCRTRLIRL